MKTITAIVMCYNEEDLIYECLSSIIPLVDQVLIWDGNFEIGNQIANNKELTLASQDKSRHKIQQAIKETSHLSVNVETIYMDGTPKMNEKDARNTVLNLSTGDYVLIVDADEIWLPSQIKRLRRYIEMNECKKTPYTDFAIRNRLYFWNPWFYVDTKHWRMFRMASDREFYGANEVTNAGRGATIPNKQAQYNKYSECIKGCNRFLFYHYGYIQPHKVEEKMKWYDHGTWRNCGSDWFNNIFMAFDGSKDSIKRLIDMNHGSIHPWSYRAHPGFAKDEFGFVRFDYPAKHPRIMAQYFDKRTFNREKMVFI